MIARLLPVVAVLAVSCDAPDPGPSLAVGASADPQNLLLANVYAAGLRYYGSAARVEISDDPLDELDDGTVRVTTGLTGRLLDRFDPDSEARSAPQVYRALAGALPEGVAAADYALAAEDKAALAVTARTADRWGSRDLTALVRDCPRGEVGAPTGSDTPDTVGDCTLDTAREFGTKPMLFDALRAGSIAAAWTTTADAAVPTDVVVLVDRKPTLLRADNVVALYRRNELDQMQLRAINEIAGVLDTAALVQMLAQVEDGSDPRSVAEQWLAENPLGR